MRTEALSHAETCDRAGGAVTVSEVAGDATAADWDDFVRTSGAAGYHEWAWRGVFERAFGHETMYLAARRDGRIDGVLPLVFMNSWVFGRSLVSLPFVNYGGIVATDAVAARALVEGAAALAARLRCSSVELRHVARQFDDLPCKAHKVAMLLPLPAGVPPMWDGLDRKVRNQVRKAQKSSLSSEDGGVELVEDFYTVFARNMRDLGTPVYSRRLFTEVLTTFGSRARVHVVRLGGAPVAAGITFRTRDAVEVPWASSLREHNSLCPNILLYWAIIERSIAERCKLLDFGRSTPDEGTFKFKRQWGAQPLLLHWEYHIAPGVEMPNTSPTNPKFRLAISAWKKLPVSVANRLGPQIVKSIP